MSKTAGLTRPTTVGRMVAALVFSATLLAGCSGSEDRRDPLESTTTAPPTSSAPDWQSKYNQDELAVYREAVQRIGAFDAKTQPIYASGKASDAAKEFFQDNLLSWKATWAQLQSFEKQGIKIARRPVVLSTEAESIKLLKGDAAEVKLLRCTDQSDLGGTMNGEPLPVAYNKPVIQKVDAYRYADGRWRFGVFTTTDSTCSP